MPILENDYIYATFHTRGAAIKQLVIKAFDRNVVMTCANQYAAHHYCNTVVGPIANRIAGACFEKNGKKFYLNQNEGNHCLHGGHMGLSELDWQMSSVSSASIAFDVEIADGHMGFPGPSQFQAIYTLQGKQLLITLKAQSSSLHYINLAPHLYCNLDNAKNINSHWLQINADSYLPIDDEKIPTGLIASVACSDFDFRSLNVIGNRIIDNNYCLNGHNLRQVATLRGQDITLTISTNQMGLQIYTCDHANRSHLTIEPQKWPNAINENAFKKDFSSSSQNYCSVTQLKFQNRK